MFKIKPNKIEKKRARVSLNESSNGKASNFYNMDEPTRKKRKQFNGVAKNIENDSGANFTVNPSNDSSEFPMANVDSNIDGMEVEKNPQSSEFEEVVSEEEVCEDEVSEEELLECGFGSNIQVRQTPLMLAAQKILQYLEYYERGEGRWASQFPPRPYQLRIIKEMFVAVAKGDIHFVVPMATGAGKTYTALMLIQLFAMTLEIKVLILMHRDNLIQQWRENVEKFCPTLRAKILNAKSLKNFNNGNLDETIFLASYQYVKGRQDINYSRFRAVILDEAHQCLSELSTQFIRKISEHECVIAGITATPISNLRSPKLGGVQSVYELLGLKRDGSNNPINGLPLRKAIDVGAICPLLIRIVKLIADEEIEFVGNNSRRHDISEQEARRKIDKPHFNNIIADVYLNGCDPVSNEPYRGKKAIVFCAGIQHAENVAAALNGVQINSSNDPYHEYRNRYAKKVTEEAFEQLSEFNVDFKNLPEEIWEEANSRYDQVYRAAYEEFTVAAAVHSKNSKEKNESLLKKYRLGGILALTGAEKLTEGFDVKEIEIVFLARPTNSNVLLTQAIGRGTRKNGDDKYCTAMTFCWDKKGVQGLHAYHLLSTAEEVRFSHGDQLIAEIRELRRNNYQEQESIVINNTARYEILDEEQEETTIIIEANKKNKGTRVLKNYQNPQRYLTQSEMELSGGINRLLSTVNSLSRAFNRIKSKTIIYKEQEDNIGTTTTTTTAATTTGTVEEDFASENIGGMNASMDFSDESNEQPDDAIPQIATNSARLTQEAEGQIIDAKTNLKMINEFFQSFSTQYDSTKSHDSSRPQSTSIKSIQEVLCDIIKQYESMTCYINHLLASSVLGHQQADDENFVSNEEQNSENLLENVEQCAAYIEHLTASLNNNANALCAEIQRRNEQRREQQRLIQQEQSEAMSLEIPNSSDTQASFIAHQPNCLQNSISANTLPKEYDINDPEFSVNILKRKNKFKSVPQNFFRIVDENTGETVLHKLFGIRDMSTHLGVHMLCNLLISLDSNGCDTKNFINQQTYSGETALDIFLENLNKKRNIAEGSEFRTLALLLLSYKGAKIDDLRYKKFLSEQQFELTGDEWGLKTTNQELIRSMHSNQRLIFKTSANLLEFLVYHCFSTRVRNKVICLISFEHCLAISNRRLAMIISSIVSDLCDFRNSLISLYDINKVDKNNCSLLYYLADRNTTSLLKKLSQRIPLEIQSLKSKDTNETWLDRFVNRDRFLCNNYLYTIIEPTTIPTTIVAPEIDIIFAYPSLFIIPNQDNEIPLSRYLDNLLKFVKFVNTKKDTINSRVTDWHEIKTKKLHSAVIETVLTEVPKRLDEKEYLNRPEIIAHKATIFLKLEELRSILADYAKDIKKFDATQEKTATVNPWSFFGMNSTASSQCTLTQLNGSEPVCSEMLAT